MIATGLWAAGLALEGLLLVWGLVASVRERSRLHRFVDHASSPDDARKVAEVLPRPHRDIAVEFLEAVRVRSTLDEALTRSVVRATTEPFAGPLPLQVGLLGLMVALALAPACLAMAGVAVGVAELAESLQVAGDAAEFVAGRPRVQALFAPVPEAFARTAVSSALLAGVWAMVWWLRRPQVREARFVRALLEAATRVRPGTPAPVAARLSELVAPERSLARPVAATVIWVVAVTAGWLALWLTGDVRVANAREPVFDVWPADRYRPSRPRSGLELPEVRGGGTPVPEGLLTLSMGPISVNVGQTPVATLDELTLPKDWHEDAPDLSSDLEGFPPEMIILGHADLAMADVLPVLEHLSTRYDLDRFHLVARRQVRVDDRDPRVIQTDLAIGLEAPEASALTIRVAPAGVTVGDGPRVSFESPTWHQRVRRAVREAPAAYEGEGRRPVAVITSPDVSYARFVGVLAAADDACPAGADCGLPGLDLSFAVSRASPSR